VLVGHSYGGFVITNAATGNPNVKALVYVAAFAPDEGDTVGGLSGREPDSLLLAPGNLTPRTFPTPDGQQAPEGYITPSAFRNVFAGDLPKAQTDFMASAQRPAALSSLSEPSGPPAWKTIRSWAVVAGRDNTIGTRNVRFMAKRARAKILNVKRASTRGHDVSSPKGHQGRPPRGGWNLLTRRLRHPTLEPGAAAHLPRALKSRIGPCVVVKPFP
jgi:pimeloyl-ACP methyl ester carboxylesterase